MAQTYNQNPGDSARYLQLIGLISLLRLGFADAQMTSAITSPSTVSPSTTLLTTSSLPSSSTISHTSSSTSSPSSKINTVFDPFPTSSISVQQPDHWPGNNDSNDYYYIFIAAIIVFIVVGVFLSHQRRRRRQATIANGRHTALANDMLYPNNRRWPAERRSAARMPSQHRRGVSSTTQFTREEGLDDRGEAPPPYKREDDGHIIDGTGPAIPLQNLSTDRLAKLPQYHEAVVASLSPGEHNAGESSRPSESRGRPGTAQQSPSEVSGHSADDGDYLRPTAASVASPSSPATIYTRESRVDAWDSR